MSIHKILSSWKKKDRYSNDRFFDAMNDLGYDLKPYDVVVDSQRQLILKMAVKIDDLEKKISKQEESV